MTSVLSANRLTDGRIVFLGANGWVDEFTNAHLLEDDEAVSQAEKFGQEAVLQNVIIDPQMVALEDHPDNPLAPKIPKTLRDKIRCLGPSILSSIAMEPKQNAEGTVGAAKTGASHVSL